MKLEINKIGFKNFLSFGSQYQTIEFKNGINVVLGKDMDKNKSNGAGKSSFLETISFALFGQIQRSVKKNQIVNWKNKKNCEVKCDFSIGEDNYSVLRCIKPDNFEIRKNNVMIEKPPTVKEYQQMLEEIIGFNYKLYMALVHSNINSSQKILKMGKTEKRKFIENIFGLEIYSIINKRAHDKINDISNQIGIIDTKIEANIRSTEDQDERINRWQEELDIMITSSNEYDIALKEYETYSNKYLNIENKYDQLKKRIDFYDKKCKLIRKTNEIIMENKIPKVRFARLTPILKDLEYIDKEKEANIEVEKNKKLLDKFVKKYGTIERIEKKEAILRKEIVRLKNLHRKLSDDHRKKHDILIEQNLDINTKRTTIESFKGGVCPTCKQKINNDEDILMLQTELRTLEVKNKKLKEEVDKLHDESYKAQDEYDVKDNTLGNIDEAKKTYYKLIELSSKKVSMTGGESEKKKLLAKTKKWKNVIKRLEDCHEKMHTRLEKYDLTLKKFSDQAEKMENAINKISELKTIKNQLMEKVKSEEDSKKRIEGHIKDENEKLAKIKRDHQKNVKIKVKLSKMLDYLEYIKDICKDENVKQYAISSLMPYLNQQINHYLSEVGYGFYTIIDKWLDAEIKGPGITNGSYGSLSGGESRGIDLALQFALLDIARLQAIIWPDILIMDEILDSSLDNESIERLIDIIQVKQSKDKGKIFIISHRNEISEYFEADNTYNIIKQGGYSKVY